MGGAQLAGAATGRDDARYRGASANKPSKTKQRKIFFYSRTPACRDGRGVLRDADRTRDGCVCPFGTSVGSAARSAGGPSPPVRAIPNHNQQHA